MTGPLLLGIDTGGTYTDAVLYDEGSQRVVAKAKAPTSHDDLSLGIAASLRSVVETAGVDPAVVAMVALSTTLATNALVESKGRPACLVSIGFDQSALERAGIGEAAALGSGDTSAVVHVRGGHNSHGQEIEPLDEGAIARAVAEHGARVEGYAVTSQFSVRNAAHEERAAEIIRGLVDAPVTLSHRLSARLNGPRRAVTALLNARLIPLVDDLVATAESTVAALGIAAPLMVVRGNGSLVASSFVRNRPIETILSGPAASLVGAAHLTGASDALISDIGGTTTDIAVLRGGEPEYSPDGAVVGGHETMVEAVKMFTHGLGGDSDVRAVHDAPGGFTLGPRRVVPISLFAVEHRDFVVDALERQLEAAVPNEMHGRFVTPTARAAHVGDLGRAERDMLAGVGMGPIAATDVVTTSMKRLTLERLVDRGLVQIAAFTPTDASHVLGDQTHHDPGPARLAASVLARQRNRFGNDLADGPSAMSTLVVARLVRSSAEALLEAAFVSDGLPSSEVGSAAVQRALDRVEAGASSAGAARLSIGSALALVGLGAPASTYYSSVAALLDTEAIGPTDADVANAIGAVVGRVRVVAEATISAPRRGLFRLHLGDEPETFYDLDLARAAGAEQLTAELRQQMQAAGAGADVEIEESWEEKTAMVDGRPLFVEGALTLVASGRPNL